jgi:hypothetical protein
MAPIAATPPWLMDANNSNSGSSGLGYKKVALDDNDMDTVHIPLNNSNMGNSGMSGGGGSGKNNNMNSSSVSSQEGGINNADIDPAIPRMILYTRVINLALSICMILISLLSILTTQSATTGVLACYVVVFACLLCCFETHLKQVSKMIALNFGFMYSAKSRAVFMMFIGTIMFSFSLFGKILGLAMIVNALFNIFILFRYPDFDNVQRDNATAEIKDFLRSNPAFTQSVYQGGANIVQSNPGNCFSFLFGLFVLSPFAFLPLSLGIAQQFFSSMFSGGGSGNNANASNSPTRNNLNRSTSEASASRSNYVSV